MPPSSRHHHPRGFLGSVLAGFPASHSCPPSVQSSLGFVLARFCARGISRESFLSSRKKIRHFLFSSTKITKFQQKMAGCRENFPLHPASIKFYLLTIDYLKRYPNDTTSLLFHFFCEYSHLVHFSLSSVIAGFPTRFLGSPAPIIFIYYKIIYQNR